MLGARYEKPVAGEYPVIPAHSQLLGSWVEAGIAGVFFWLYLLALFVRAIWMPLKDDRRLRWYMTYMAVFYIWGILFSPISARIETAMMIGLVFTQAVPRLGGSSVAKGGLGMPTHPVAA
jgi:O-antigen ligase